MSGDQVYERSAVHDFQGNVDAGKGSATQQIGGPKNLSLSYNFVCLFVCLG